MPWGGKNLCTECDSSLHEWRDCPNRSDAFMARHGKEVAARLLREVGLTRERVIVERSQHERL